MNIQIFSKVFNLLHNTNTWKFFWKLQFHLQKNLFIILKLSIENKKESSQLGHKPSLPNPSSVPGMSPEVWQKNGLFWMSKEKATTAYLHDSQSNPHTKIHTFCCKIKQNSSFWLIHKRHISLIKADNFHWTHLHTEDWHTHIPQCNRHYTSIQSWRLHSSCATNSSCC